MNWKQTKKAVDPVTVSIEDRICNDCVFNESTDTFPNDASKECCSQYPYPQSKPHAVLFLHAHCPFYTQRKSKQ